ncbi:PEP-CTERM motif protein [Planctomycetes bacterium CA13]|uniref:PEP-CTERM motif protein n=1 Tax=Novipirellula herctigrandis TaxID=2527986 RepID=A0A5C5YPQ3_9BACT|nr:PEP-CTERM motif protein [Planctomycetes bacterium CA13]
MRNIKRLAVSAALACFALSQSASAAIVYTEDFEGGTVGTALNTLNGPTGNWGGGASGNISQASIGSGTEFGAASQYLDFSRTTAGFSFMDHSAPVPDVGLNTPVTFSFDLYAASAAAFPTYLRAVASGDTGNLDYTDIGTGTFSSGGTSVGTDWNFGTAAHFDIVATLTAVGDGADGTTTSAAGVIDVFVDGTQTVFAQAMSFPGGGGAGAGSTVIDGFALWANADATAATTTNRVLIDNVVVSVTAVPEPSTFALLGLGSLGLVASRRRRK